MWDTPDIFKVPRRDPTALPYLQRRQKKHKRSNSEGQQLPNTDSETFGSFGYREKHNALVSNVINQIDPKITTPETIACANPSIECGKTLPTDTTVDGEAQVTNADGDSREIGAAQTDISDDEYEVVYIVLYEGKDYGKEAKMISFTLFIIVFILSCIGFGVISLNKRRLKDDHQVHQQHLLLSQIVLVQIIRDY